MSAIPFTIPESLASYAVQYASFPDKTIHRLRKQLKKRGADPVGYFLLGWFYHRKGLKQKAIDCALKAKNFAPGSPFFEKLHYFFVHPKLFDAWQLYGEPTLVKQEHADASHRTPDPVLELDTLIKKLSDATAKRIKNKDLPPSDSNSSLSSNFDDVNDIVSETLAEIHEKQGKTEAAIQTYKRLMEYDDKKRDYYIVQIARLEKMKEDEEE
jgi:tetratricopeptide (TPR) repeat protein